MPPRDQTVDVLRGIGMVVVVMGHIDFTPIGGALDVYLYMFNVPLFFIVAGYTWRPRAGVGLGSVVLRRVRTIYLPYVVLFVVSLLYGSLLVPLLAHQPVPPFHPIRTVTALVFASDWLNTVPTYNFALWFLPIFFLASVVFAILQRVKVPWLYAAILVALYAVSYPFQLLVPGRPILAINVLPVGLLFMGIGHILRRLVAIERIPVIVIGALFGLTLLITLVEPGNIAKTNGYLYPVCAVASFIVYARVAHQLRSSTWLAFLGRNSLIVFGIHGLIANTYQYTRIPELLARHWNGALLYLVDLGYVLVGSTFVVLAWTWARRRVPAAVHRLRSRVAAPPSTSDA